LQAGNLLSFFAPRGALVAGRSVASI
jgi:hypothetical protein